LSWQALREVLVESARTSAMLFTIVIGASLFANFLNFTALPISLRDFVTQFDVHPVAIIIAICAIYVVLGTAMESLSMMLLTVPLFFPLVTALGFDPVWFGIIVVCVIEISLITPPIGMNIFVLSSVLPDVPTTTIWRGVMPFVAADILRMGVLIAFPALSLYLPQLLRL
jgi:TRAP-type C4-dicarboxylate transport system permease large subunit